MTMNERQAKKEAWIERMTEFDASGQSGINATYLLSDEFTEEDAKEFSAFLVNELY